MSTLQIAEENVLIQAGECSLTILPHLGGKIASIKVGNLELLQQPLADYAPRTRSMSFDSSDASGWDECLPSVAACEVETAGGTTSIPDRSSIPDHGDLWRVPWSVIPPARDDTPSEDAAGGSVTLRGECFSLPLTLERKVTLSGSREWVLRADYLITNTGNKPVPWSWAAHPLFAAEEGDRIVLPNSIHTLRLEGSAGERLGKGGDSMSWPTAQLADGDTTDLSYAQGPGSGIGDKLFAGPLTAKENFCALERRKAGLTISVEFDATATPYLGMWICYGGWPQRPGPKQVCVALEPATAPVDSLAVTGPWSRTLAPGASFSWSMTVHIYTEQKGKTHE
ncbi:MAG: hypothetical protein WBQ94_19865 [Terracidiphilus sp.]